MMRWEGPRWEDNRIGMRLEEINRDEKAGNGMKMGKERKR